MIDASLRRVESTGRYLNEAKRDDECMRHIHSVFASLGLPARLDAGRLLKEDTFAISFTSSSNSKLLSRSVLLFETRLLVLKRNLFNKYELVQELNVSDMKRLVLNTTTNGLSVYLEGSSGCVECMFRSGEQRSAWHESLQSVKIPHRLVANHVFALCDFGRDIKECHVCQAFLSGIFFQGVKCKFCEIAVHKQCLSGEMDACKVNKVSSFEVLTAAKNIMLNSRKKSSFSGSLSLLDASLGTGCSAFMLLTFFKRTDERFFWRETFENAFASIVNTNHGELK